MKNLNLCYGMSLELKRDQSAQVARYILGGEGHFKKEEAEGVV